MRNRPWVILTLCMIAAPAVFADEVASKPSLAMNVGVESFRWEEFSGGQRLLSETGPRLAVGFTLDHLRQGDQPNPYAAEARVYLGVVDYDGQTQAGVSAKTDVDYFGASAEVMGGLRLAGSPRMDLLGGLGVDTWIRDLQDGVTANGSVAQGYREDYFILYSKLGPGFLFQSEARRAYLQFGLKYPLYTYERVYLTSLGFDSDVELAPGKQLSGYAKWQMNWGRETGKPRFGASFYYDSFRFSASASKTVSAVGALYRVHQPESRMDVLGARLEYYF
ncbi:MAG: hypothetical protein HY274_00355 [Gammaproteobacteria bacterium]|nr:hypothetical protein [Gammaproteobacteria bacterium]